VVEGTVVNKITSAGISGATVLLLGPNRNRYEATTDLAGNFRIAGVKPGDYRPNVTKEGFTSDSNDALPGFSSTTHVGSDPVRMRLTLIPPATLRGRVFGVDGEPAAKINVILYPNPRASEAVTAEDGSFAFEDVQPGTVTLLAQPKVVHAAPGKDGVRIETVPTYFPSTPDRAAAAPITVQAGVVQGGYDVRLQTAPVYRVRGVVLQEDGKPAAKAVVNLVSKSPGGPDIGTFISFAGNALTFSIRDGLGVRTQMRDDPVVTETDGVFEFPSVQAGEYVLEAESDTVRDEGRREINHYGNTTITVGRRDMDDLRIQLTQPFDISYSLQLADGTPVPATVFAMVRLAPEDGLRGATGRRQEDGTGRFDYVTPGRYRILAEVQAGGSRQYVTAAFLGANNVLGQIVELSRASPPLRIVLKPAGTIRGVVEGIAENGVEATVVLMPQNLTGTGRTLRTDAQGIFEVSGLPPGGYYVIALDRFDLRMMMDTRQLMGLVPRASTVKAEEGATTSVQLRLIQASR
jgi:hypothetical protein